MNEYSGRGLCYGCASIPHGQPEEENGTLGGNGGGGGNDLVDFSFPLHLSCRRGCEGLLSDVYATSNVSR